MQSSRGGKSKEQSAMKCFSHLVAAAAFSLAVPFASDAGTVAVAEVGSRSEKDLAVFEAAVRDAGHTVKKISGPMKVLEKPETYDGVDAIVFTGGWNDPSFGEPGVARRLVAFVARGGGALLGAFRGGGVRASSSLPAFPEVARTCNRVHSPWIWAEGESALAKAVGDRPMMLGGWDHIVLRPGEQGTVFAKNCEDPVGVFGEFGLGRVIVFGSFLSVAQDDADVEGKKRLYAAMAEYLLGGRRAPERSDAAAAAEARALAGYDRRVMLSRWTADERGGGRRPGVIPALRDNTVVPVESRAMLLEFFAKKLADGRLAAQCGELAKRFRAAADAIKALGDAKKREAASGGLGKLGSVEDDRKAEESLRTEFAALAAGLPYGEADALSEKARVAVRAQRTAAIVAEHSEDVAALPGHVSRLSSADSDVRLDAARELGRIGEVTPDVVAALVKALDDPEDKVRVQSAISLGWMQAGDAVPALIAKAHQNGDMALKRRAIQALGQIGDDRAVPEVMKALDSSDRYSFENAILALGWLKAKEAVPRLVEIASDDSEPIMPGDPKTWHKLRRPPPLSMSVMNRRGSAVTALGYIGDESAVPALKRIVATCKPMREDELSIKSHRGVSLNRLAKDALETIAAGGRAEKGVRQPAVWSSKPVFYGIVRGNNALVGRISTILDKMSAFDGDRESLFLPYILDAGMTGIHAAWGGDFCRTGAGAEKVVREMDDLGLRWIGTMPSAGLTPMYDVHRAAQERAFSRLGDLASYAGAWSEETWGVSGLIPGENPDPSVCEIGPAARAARVARLEENGEALKERWRENQDWLRARRKGFALTFSMSSGNYYESAIGTPSVVDQIDNAGPEKYQSFGRVNTYLIERFRNGETRSVMTEFYNWMAPSNEHVLRGCWQNAVRSKCYYPFSLNQFAPFADWYAPWTWDKGRWELYAKVFRHVRANEGLYAVAPSATEVAVLLSERSAVSLRHMGVKAQSSMLEATDEAGVAILTALSQSHLDADVVFVDNATDKKLSKYKVLFLTTAKVLTDREQAMLRRWVAGGGTLVCEGTVSLFDAKNLMRRCEYAIADLLGVHYVDTVFKKTGEVFAQRNGTLKGKTIYPVSQGLDNIFSFSEHVWRTFKPTDCIAVASGGVEYDASLGIDRVELAGARAVQTFSDGSPALTVNDFGRGRVYFFASNRPSCGHVAKDYELYANTFDFWPGVRETYEMIARDGLAHAGSAPAVDLPGAPKELDVAVYSQNGGKRLVVHLLDYDTSRSEIADVALRINGKRPIRAVYRPGGERLPVSDRTVRLGTVSVYDMAVVEFD